ncbi:MAG TPA: glycosyltransferase [Candidatus Hydrogenedentes bacterium]|nr:glycosyltransferase [Candidatus Hydrogenedentota bacterium]
MLPTPDTAGNAPAAPSVSIVLLTLDGMPEFERALDMIARQEYPGPVEIVHIDSGSTDGTLEVAAKRGLQTHCIRPEEFHHGRTRNLGADLARHDIVVYLSQDAIPANESWLRSLTQAFSERRVAAVFGRQVAPEGVGPLRRYAMEWTYGPEREVRDLAAMPRLTLGSYRFSNANSALRAELVRRHRFDETSPMCEDQAMCRALLHAGHVVVYEPDAAVYHAHERTVWGEFVWAVDNGIALRRNGILGDPRLGGEMRYGLRRIADELAYFLRRGRLGLAAKGLLINAAKWVGVQLGKRETRLPRALMRRISTIARRETVARASRP